MNTNARSSHEPGYRPVLIREEAKKSLRDYRISIECPSGVVQERHFATAAIELVLELVAESEEMEKRLIKKASGAVQQDMSAIRAAA